MIHSLAGLLDEGGISRARPFRTPHHTASMAAIVGGGRGAKPGEISLAHHGVLFLDELPEFPRTVLETLRQPIETGDVVVARANAHVRYPCRFMLVAAANPCRCGHLADPARACARVPDCGADYLGRISGPLMDRFDLRIEVPPVTVEDLGLPARRRDQRRDRRPRRPRPRRAARPLRRPRRRRGQRRRRGRPARGGLRPHRQRRAAPRRHRRHASASAPAPTTGCSASPAPSPTSKPPPRSRSPTSPRRPATGWRSDRPRLVNLPAARHRMYMHCTCMHMCMDVMTSPLTVALPRESGRPHPDCPVSWSAPPPTPAPGRRGRSSGNSRFRFSIFGRSL